MTNYGFPPGIFIELLSKSAAYPGASVISNIATKSYKTDLTFNTYYDALVEKSPT
jgi:hypothetical protein